MINPLELRINNLVYGVSDRIETVYGVVGDKVYTLHPKLETDPFENHFKDISPIPLWREIMDKVAAKETGKNKFVISKWLELVLEDDNWSDPSFDVYINGTYITCVQYLHQLQNLYHILAGQELEITI